MLRWIYTGDFDVGEADASDCLLCVPHNPRARHARAGT
jgi:hypothetical protein